MSDNQKTFEDKKYVLIKNAVDSKIIDLISTYALLDEKNNLTLEKGKHPQIHNSHSQYADCLMDSMLLEMQQLMEANTGLKLYPTYSYYRVYRPGAILEKHKDRPSCEISTTITLKFNYLEADYKWPIYIEGAECAMETGDLVIYRGCEVEHWREEFIAPKGSYHIQVFLHYVDANGPYADYKYDRRPSIGFNKERNLDRIISETYVPNKHYIIFSP